MAKTDLTAQRLRELLHYCPDTGVFTRATERHSGRWKVNDQAGYQRPDGRRYIRLDGRLYKSSRLAWLYVTGEWPRDMIDHVDGNRGNDAISNLRDVDRSINMQNIRRATKKSKSGLLGVSWHENGCWVAFIKRPSGGTKYLGLYDTQEAAHAAYIDAKRVIHLGGTL